MPEASCRELKRPRHSRRWHPKQRKRKHSEVFLHTVNKQCSTHFHNSFRPVFCVYPSAGGASLSPAVSHASRQQFNHTCTACTDSEESLVLCANGEVKWTSAARTGCRIPPEGKPNWMKTVCKVVTRSQLPIKAFFFGLMNVFLILCQWRRNADRLPIVGFGHGISEQTSDYNAQKYSRRCTFARHQSQL